MNVIWVLAVCPIGLCVLELWSKGHRRIKINDHYKLHSECFSKPGDKRRRDIGNNPVLHYKMGKISSADLTKSCCNECPLGLGCSSSGLVCPQTVIRGSRWMITVNLSLNAFAITHLMSWSSPFQQCSCRVTSSYLSKLWEQCLNVVDSRIHQSQSFCESYSRVHFADTLFLASSHDKMCSN